MVPGHAARVHAVAISCPPEAVWPALAGVLEVQTYGEKLHVFVDDVPCARAADRGRAGGARASPTTGCARSSSRMEEAFISLVQAASATA